MNIKLLIIFLYHSFNDNRVCSDASGFIPEIGGFCFSLYLSQSCAMFISFIDFFLKNQLCSLIVSAFLFLTALTSYFYYFILLLALSFPVLFLVS